MECVTECNTSTQIAINDTQFDNIPICRDFKYYVNPDSDNIVELGTIDHPYKHISYALVEVLNYHSHSDRNLTIYLMEYTRNEITENAWNIINITNVEIKPYTLRSVAPDKAHIVGMDSADIVSAPSTSFSIIKSYEMRFDEIVTNNNNFTDVEKTKIQLERHLILVMRSSLMIYNMEIISEYSNIFDDILITFPVYLQTKTLTFKDLHINISGTILRAFDPLNLVIENIDVDYYRNSGGFDMDIECNYPEANINAYAHLTNGTFYNSQAKIINPVKGDLLKSELPGNFIIKDYYCSTYIAPNEHKGTLNLLIQSKCRPDDAADRYFNITNATIPVLEPGVGTAGNFLLTNINSELYRKTDSYLENINWSNVQASWLPSISFIGNLQSVLVLRNIITVNSSSIYSSQSHSAYGRIEMYDMYFEHTDALNNFIVDLRFIGQIVMDNITINNNDILNTDPAGFFYFIPFDDGVIQASNLNIMNSDIGVKPIIDFVVAGTVNMSIQNVFAQNVTLGTDTKMFKTQSLRTFNMRNSTFIGIKSQVLGDTTPKILELSSLALADQQNYAIVDTYVEQSKIGFIELSGLANNEMLSSIFSISNFTYQNSYLDFPQDLISFIGIETKNEFQIELADIKMSNISFIRTGRLLLLEHQTNTILKISNWQFNNLIGAKVDVKSSNLNFDINTKVNITNATATSLSGASNSFISIDEGGQLYLYDSNFTNIDNTERGAVLNAGYQNSYTEVHNSTFKNNLSIYGAVANVQDGSVIKFYDSNLTENFAIQSGAIQVSSNGRFELYRCNIINNYAYTLSVSEVFITSAPSIFSNSSIHDNIVLSSTEILEEFNSCETLWFLSDVFKEYIQSNPNLLSTVSLPLCIQCISGALAITNNTFIKNQPIFVNSYLSTINIENSIIHNISSDSSILVVIQSNITISNLTSFDLYTSSQGKFIKLSFGSKAVLDQIDYVNSTMEFIEGLSSYLSILRFTTRQIQLNQYLINWIQWLNLQFNNFSVTALTTNIKYMINVAKSQVDLIQSVVVNDVEASVMQISSSNVTDINACNLTSSIHITQSSIGTFQNSRISNSGSNSVLFGGALLIENSNSTMRNMTFEHNVAQTGGAIHISCDAYDICQNVINNSTFSNNTAVKQGGAINYDFRRPELSNFTFNNNKAAYGSNIASYPVRIVNSVMMDESIILTNVTSGMTYHETIKMFLVDYDSQTMNLVSNNQIRISSVTNEARLKGVDYSVLVNGQANFENLQFVYGPGQK